MLQGTSGSGLTDEQVATIVTDANTAYNEQYLFHVNRDPESIFTE
jgi:hypothetical protein